MADKTALSTHKIAATPQTVRAPRGMELSCRGWPQEAALRLLMNSLDPEVAERQSKLSIVAGVPAPARDWDAFRAVQDALRDLDSGQTLRIRGGVLTGNLPDARGFCRVIVETQAAARRGNLHAFTAHAAAGWLYVGTQSVLQAAHEIIGAAARERFGGTLAGKLVVGCGLDVVSSAQPLAATLHGAAFLGIEVDAERLKRCVKSGYCEVMVTDLDEALRILKNAVRRREPASVGLQNNCDDAIPVLAQRGVLPDLLLPNRTGRNSLPAESAAIRELQKLGSMLVDGESCDLFSRGYSEPLTWIALSGAPADIFRTDSLLLELFPKNEHLKQWVGLVKKHVRFQGLPARVIWLSPAERMQFVVAANELVASQQVQAPLVFGRVSPGLGKRAHESSDSSAAELAADAVTLEVASEGTQPRRIALTIVADGSAGFEERVETVLVGEQR